MDLVDLMYKYINKFINSYELIEKLKGINLNGYSSKEIKAIKELTEKVQDLVSTIPNEEDEIEKKRIDERDKIINILKTGLNNSDQNIKSFCKERYEILLKEKDKIRDGGKRYTSIFNLLTNDSLVNYYASKMNEKELLDFITRYIYAPLPPMLSQEEFNDLVRAGIEEDNRESLWRLAFNYNGKNKDFSLIEDYFLEKRDAYYLIELISAVKEDLDLKRLMSKILNTNDVAFINDLIERNKKLDILSSDEIKKIREEIN